MKKILLLMGCLCIAGLGSGVVNAEQTDSPIGQVGGAELKIGFGPRPVAMGEAFVAQADDLNSTAWNPAGLAQIPGHEAGFMHSIYLEETSLEYLAYVQPVFKGAGVGVNLIYLNYGKMDKVNEQMELEGDFTPSVLIGSIGYGQWLMPVLAVGGAIKVISQNIDAESYTAVAVDLGFLFKLGLEGLRLGLVVQNLGTQLAESDLPMNAKAGAACVLPFKFADKDIWNLLLDVNLPFGDINYTSANIGTEYWFNNMIALRAGYKVKDTGGLGGITGLTAGAGVKIPVGEALAINLDYAMLSFGDLGLTHQIAVAVNF